MFHFSSEARPFRNGLGVAFAWALRDVERQMEQKLPGRSLQFFLVVVLVTGASGWILLAAAAQIQAGVELRYEEPKYLTGEIYDTGPETKKLRFKFKRVATRSGSTLNVERDYTYPDGKLAVQERAVYQGNDLEFYELKEPQIGAEGSARIQRIPGNPAKRSVEFQYRPEPGGAPKTRTEALAENTLIGDMVGPFLASHWDALSRGEKVKCRYIVVPRRETVGFTFIKVAEGSQQGRQVSIVKMEASSPLVGTLVDPLFFTLDSSPSHHVLEYTGRTTPKIQVRGKWKDLDAVTVFDSESAR